MDLLIRPPGCILYDLTMRLLYYRDEDPSWRHRTGDASRFHRGPLNGVNVTSEGQSTGHTDGHRILTGVVSADDRQKGLLERPRGAVWDVLREVSRAGGALILTASYDGGVGQLRKASAGQFLIFSWVSLVTSGRIGVVRRLEAYTVLRFQYRLTIDHTSWLLVATDSRLQVIEPLEESRSLPE